MNISIRDPLSLLPSQSGLVVSPLVERGAVGQGTLDSRQRAIVIGDPIPIVFGRRITVGSVDIGGVFVSPGATEGRYENDGTTNELTVDLQLVLSEGELPALELRDVFQRACRVGTWVQTYDRRAGSFTPGNFITAVSGTELWQCPYYCGTSGTYDNMTTLAYQNTHADGDSTWDKQVHCFVREGMQVTRILDDTYGPSNNVVDLALYLIRQSARLPEALLDTTAFTEAANFTNTNNFYYNGIFDRSTNLEDWLEKIAKGFMLRLSDKNGAKGFRPALPINEDFTLQTTAVTWVFDFTEEHILPGGFEIQYIPLADRKPITAEVLWRQQPDNDIGIIRTAQVGYSGEATDGPFEQYDLSDFCTSEDHAVKVGMFYVARRKYITHTLRITVKPDSFNTTLVLGDLVRVLLRRETEVEAISQHNYLYEVERINKTISGAVELDLIHFPIDDQGRSLVALDVDAAAGGGYVLATGREDFDCDDTGRRTDTTALSDVGGNLPDLPTADDYDYLGSGGTSDSPSGSSNDGAGNPADPFEGPPTPQLDPPDPDNGEEVGVNAGCTNPKTTWFRRYGDGPWQQISLSQTFTTRVGDSGWQLYAETCCEDPGSPSGYAPCQQTDPSQPIPTPDGEEAVGLVYPGAVRYRVFWGLGFGQSTYIGGENGIAIAAANFDGFCSPGRTRLFIGYYNASSVWTWGQFPSGAGCTGNALQYTLVYAELEDESEVLIFNAGNGPVYE